MEESEVNGNEKPAEKESTFKKVIHVFWREECQDENGNAPHTQGLIALNKEDLSHQIK